MILYAIIILSLINFYFYVKYVQKIGQEEPAIQKEISQKDKLLGQIAVLTNPVKSAMNNILLHPIQINYIGKNPYKNFETRDCNEIFCPQYLVETPQRKIQYTFAGEKEISKIEISSDGPAGDFILVNVYNDRNQKIKTVLNPNKNKPEISPNFGNNNSKTLEIEFLEPVKTRYLILEFNCQDKSGYKYPWCNTFISEMANSNVDTLKEFAEFIKC